MKRQATKENICNMFFHIFRRMCGGKARTSQSTRLSSWVAVVSLIAVLVVLLIPVTAAAEFGYITQWGGFGKSDGPFIYLSGVAVDKFGSVYVTGNKGLQKFTSSGAYITQWGSPGESNGQFWGIGGVAIDTSGNVYVVDGGNNRIQKFTSSGAYITQWGRTGAGDGQFDSPEEVALGPSGNVYVADTGNSRIQKFTSSGAYITQWGGFGSANGKFWSANGVAIDASGNVYVADRGKKRIQKFTSSGAYITQWGGFGSANGKFMEPEGVAVDTSGNVYATDYGYVYDTNTRTARIQKFASSGAFIAKWGSYGTGNGQFNTPNGIAVDASGNIYVADNDNYSIQKFGELSSSEPSPPVISSLKITGKFAPSGKTTPVSDTVTTSKKKKKKIKRGATIRYKLSEVATVKLSMQKKLKGLKLKQKGKKKKKRCVSNTKKNKRKLKSQIKSKYKKKKLSKKKLKSEIRKASCILYKKKGSLTRSGIKGMNKVSFSGRIGKRKLARGSYRLVATATDDAGNVSKPKRKSFKIVKAKKKKAKKKRRRIKSLR